MPINKTTLQELKEKLLQEKEDLEKELSRFAIPTGTPGDYKTQFTELGSSEEENASEMEEYTSNVAMENTLEKKLKDVNKALSVMNKKNKYGICQKCQEEINIERLKIHPSAKTCMNCD